MKGDRRRRALATLILLGCGLAMLLAAIGILAPRSAPQPIAPRPVRAGTAALPVEPLPPVEPLIVQDMTPDRARAINAATPFVSGPIAPAPPFRFAGPADERERALTCLASAVLYEAGDDAIGEQAVAQVVLNRLRHPVYPKSVCGVVFQGSERTTGCQFTFSCDGALDRHPPAEAWKRARGVADKALSGFVYKPVGTATHYHTDWVVPYWSGTLDKIAMVHTHIFFRWRGGWGQPAALHRAYQGPERIDPRIAGLADQRVAPLLTVDPAALADGAPGARDILFIPGVPTAALKGAGVRLMDDARGEYGLLLDPAAFPGSYAVAAVAICQTRPTCTVMGWTRAERVPAALPVPPAVLRTVSFLYRRATAGGREEIYWNCRQFPRPAASQCLPGTEPARSAAPMDPAHPPPAGETAR